LHLRENRKVGDFRPNRQSSVRAKPHNVSHPKPRTHMNRTFSVPRAGRPRTLHPFGQCSRALAFSGEDPAFGYPWYHETITRTAAKQAGFSSNPTKDDNTGKKDGTENNDKRRAGRRRRSSRLARRLHRSTFITPCGGAWADCRATKLARHRRRAGKTAL
jgi:hypothetical protein